MTTEKNQVKGLGYTVHVAMDNVITITPNEYPSITKANADESDYFHANTCKRVFGVRGGVTDDIIKYHRNGKTQTWKSNRNADRFRIPIKYGLYSYGEINETNGSGYHLACDCPLLTMPQQRESLTAEVIPYINEVAARAQEQVAEAYADKVIAADGYADGGEPYTDEELDLINTTPDPEPVKYRVDVQGVGENIWSTNAKEYDDPESAERAAKDLFSRWMGCSAWRVVPATTPRRERVLDEQKGTVTK